MWIVAEHGFTGGGFSTGQNPVVGGRCARDGGLAPERSWNDRFLELDLFNKSLIHTAQLVWEKLIQLFSRESGLDAFDDESLKLGLGLAHADVADDLAGDDHVGRRPGIVLDREAEDAKLPRNAACFEVKIHALRIRLDAGSGDG